MVAQWMGVHPLLSGAFWLSVEDINLNISWCLMLIQQRSNEKYGRETVCFWICSWYIPLYSSLACELRSITELQLRINQSRKRKHKKFFSSDACPLFRRKYKSVLNFVNFILSWKMHFVKKLYSFWWNDQNISRYLVYAELYKV